MQQKIAICWVAVSRVFDKMHKKESKLIGVKRALLLPLTGMH